MGKEDRTPLLSLDGNVILLIARLLTSPRDLASLQQCCKDLYSLLQDSSSWAHVLSLNYGLQVRATSAPATSAGTAAPPERGVEADGPGPGAILPHCKGLARLLASPTSDLHPVRFGALVTDGGVHEGDGQYWADNLFIPNAWSPYCSKHSYNVNVLGVLKAGTGDAAEVRHRGRLINCCKHVTWQWLQEGDPPEGEVEVEVVPALLEKAAKGLQTYSTPQLESLFVGFVDSLVAGRPHVVGLLGGLPGTREEARQAALALAASIRERPWLSRAYRLAFLPHTRQEQHQQPQPQQRPQRHQQGVAALAEAGGGQAAPLAAAEQDEEGEDEDEEGSSSEDSDEASEGGDAGDAGDANLPYVVDEQAVQEDLMSGRDASSVALLHGISVSRAGRVSCPVQCGAVLAGMLPPGWHAHAHTHAGAVAAPPPPPPGGQAPAPAPASVTSALVASLGQGAVAELDGAQDAATVLSACASGCLPPWVRHVVCPHAQWIEFLPRHLWAHARGGAGTEAAAAEGREAATGPAVATDARAAADDAALLLPVQPVLWFRFTERAEFARHNRGAAARRLLRRYSQPLRRVIEALPDIPAAYARDIGLLKAEGAAAAAGGGGSRGTGHARALAEADRRSVLDAVRRAVDVARRLQVPLCCDLPELGQRLAREGVVAHVDPQAHLAAARGHVEELLACLLELPGWLSQLGTPPHQLHHRHQQQQQQQQPRNEERQPRDGDVGEGREEGAHAFGDQEADVDEETGVAEAEAEVYAAANTEAARVQVLAALQQNAALLGPEGVAERARLACALRALAAEMEEVAATAPAGPAVREVRNDELLRRLPVELPPPVMMVAPAAAAAAEAACVRASVGSDGAGALPPTDGACGFVRPLPGPHAALEPPPPEGWAAERLFNPTLQGDVDEGRAVMPQHSDRGHRVVHLAAPLLFPVAAQAVVFKAIWAENLADMLGWDDGEPPNVDVQYVGLQGRVVRLPPGVQAVAAAE